MAVVMKIGPVAIGSQRLIISCSDFTYDKVESLREAVAEIRRKPFHIL